MSKIIGWAYRARWWVFLALSFVLVIGLKAGGAGPIAVGAGTILLIAAGIGLILYLVFPRSFR